jgi:hypothetical protein
MHVGQQIGGKTRKSSHGLSLYPRTELLKDQFTTAVAKARLTDKAMRSSGRRKMTVGAYYGETPLIPTVKAVSEWQGWVEAEDMKGFVCPYLYCSETLENGKECEGRMVWMTQDIQAGKERLVCEHHPHCAGQVTEDEIMLTRSRMHDSPPDFLFTTTEMVNQLMSQVGRNHIIGVGAASGPDLVLLDEVHTYGGIHGAQVAYLLRRWKNAINGNPTFVGLSATLAGATDFFGQITGVGPNDVTEIRPNGEMVKEGAEYQVALRGDPVSGASLLSTSIQTSMLVRRILDHSNRPHSRGLYGSRVFLFTDDLDVNNRLFDDLNDAEGKIRKADQFKQVKDPLAVLRSSDKPDREQRLQQGQSWELAQEIGHDLGEPLEIERTSSQDAGVERGTDIVVATASLEVGFNDPEVGAVIQHKAPMSMASFLQRRGRAGRPREMRPWTIVVLSDYGRDRIAYQNYDALFDPKIRQRVLPISNRYVMRIQAVFAFLDWLADYLKSDHPDIDVWRRLSSPARSEKPKEKAAEKAIIRMAHGLLNGNNEKALASLRQHLKDALSISAREVKMLFWEPPRALMTTVIPTIARRLETQWQKYGGGKEPMGYNPLPEFVPGALFDDLNLPEVEIRIPGRDEKKSPERMRVRRAIQEFAPGRVSRRFGKSSQFDSHWVPIPDHGPESDFQELSIEDVYTPSDEIGPITVWGHEGNNPIEISCFRPHAVKTRRVDRDEIRISSSAFPKWRTNISPSSEEGAITHAPLESSPWSKIVGSTDFYTHNQGSHVEVCRVAIGSDARVSFNDPSRDPLETEIRFTDGQGKPTCIGYTQRVDGIRFSIEIPEEIEDFVHGDDRKAMALRRAYLKYRLNSHEELSEVTNPFQRDWLQQSLVAVLTVKAEELIGELDNPLKEALSRVRKDLGEHLQKALKVVFGASVKAEDEGEHEHNLKRILSLCENDQLLKILANEASALWSTKEDFSNWVKRRFLSTVGNALLEACNLSGIDFETGDLYLDIDPGPTSTDYSETKDIGNGAKIWITESSMGGTGIVEGIEQQLGENPDRFFRLAESALEASDLEMVDSQLKQILELDASKPDVESAVARVREAEGISEQREASDALFSLLREYGVQLTHSVRTALNIRLLRPGSDKNTDSLIRKLLRDWNQLEEGLGIDIEARVFAYLKSLDPSLKELMPDVGGNPDDSDWRFVVIYSLIWARGNAVRSRGLRSYNPFADLPETDRLLVIDALPSTSEEVSVGENEWVTRARDVLRDSGEVVLTTSSEDSAQLKRSIFNFTGQPISVGYIQGYPRLVGITQDGDTISARLHLDHAV